ncbi:hypothetical protein BDI4_540023 [Burkholderia diffusa]|nr:hypothetical protein BDI4_540023 [Burkholderia diffusa]
MLFGKTSFVPPGSLNNCQIADRRSGQSHEGALAIKELRAGVVTRSKSSFYYYLLRRRRMEET